MKPKYDEIDASDRNSIVADSPSAEARSLYATHLALILAEELSTLIKSGMPPIEAIRYLEKNKIQIIEKVRKKKLID